ncbi:MAG: eIF2A-related protein, partial [Pirellulaceae bacterium]
ANDIQRYLDDETVVACPPSAAYRFRKFARRNKVAIAAGSTIAAALLIGIFGTSWQAIRATNAEHESQRNFESEKLARQDADNAREKEQKQREIADEQKNAAIAAQQLATESEQRAEQQRQLAEDRELLARRNLYAAHMNLAQDAWDRNDIPRVLELLERHVPAPGEPDWRSFEWYYLLGECTRDELTIESYAFAFSPDGKLIAYPSSDRKTISLMDIETRKVIRVFHGIDNARSLAFSPDGRTLAAASWGRIGVGNYPGECKLWDVESGKHLRDIGVYQNSIVSIAFTPDGKKLVTADGGTLDSKNIPGVVRVWDVTTGQQLHELKGHTKYINSMAVSPDGKRLVTTGRHEVRFWDLESGQPIEGLAVDGYRHVAWSPDGKSLATNGNEIRIWDAASGEEIAQFGGGGAGTGGLAFSPDSSQIVAASQGESTVRLWNIETQTELAVFRGHSQWLFHVGFSPDGKRIASTGRDGTVKLWSTEITNGLYDIIGSDPPVEEDPGRDRVSLSPDGRLLASTQNSTTIEIYSAKSLQRRVTLDVGENVHAIDFSPDVEHLAVAHSRGFQIWDVQTAELVREQRLDSPIWTLDFSPDGSLLAIGTDAREVELYHADSFKPQMTFPHIYDTPLRKVLFSPDGKTLGVIAIGRPAEIHIWDVEEGRHLLASNVQRSYLQDSNQRGLFLLDLAFSPDGGTLAVSMGNGYRPQDGAITKLWDVSSGLELATLRGNDAFHTSVTFSSDGRTLATSSNSGEIKFWDLETYEGRMSFSWEGHDVASLVFTPDATTLVSTDTTADVRLWRSADDERIAIRERAGIYRRATEYANKNEWQKAIDSFSDLLKSVEDTDVRVDVRIHRGEAFAEVGRWDEAIADFRRVA